MKNIPRAFCVTLKETPLRIEGFIEMARLAGIEVNPFYGVFGNRMGLLSKFPNEIESSNPNVKLNEMAVGCGLSHFVLWHVLKYLPEDEFLIFEDDAILDEKFKEKFEEYYSNLPSDWQIAYVGWLKYGGDINPVIVNKNISIRIPSGTHAYLVKKEVLDSLIQCLMPFQSPLDLTIIHRLLPKIKYYVFEPSLVSQRSYLNTSDPVWTSLVYDWKNDLYGCKKDILRNLFLETGWYNLENNDQEQWVWSAEEFSIRIPLVSNIIHLKCSTPIENELEIICGEERTIYPLAVGNNNIQIISMDNDTIKGRVLNPFVPSKIDSNSQDDRKLGICLKSIDLNVGLTKTTVGVKEIAKKIAPGFSLDF